MFCLTNTGFVQCHYLGSHKVCCTPVLYFALFSIFFFCVLCLTNIGFVQCFSVGSNKVCCMLVFNFALFSNFLFCVLCLTNIVFVQCFSFRSLKVCCMLGFNFLFCVVCLANIGFVQCFSFGSREVSYTLLLCFSQNFVLRVLPHKHRVCAVLLPRLPSSLLHGCVYFALFSHFLLYVFCLTNIGLVQCFSLLVFFVLSNKLRFVQWFFPGSPRICTLYFFALCYSILSLCSAFFPSLIYSSVDSRKVGSSLLLHLCFIWSICSVCFILHCLQWCYFLGAWRFWMIMSSFALFCHLVRVFRHAASSSRGLLPCPSVFAPLCT